MQALSGSSRRLCNIKAAMALFDSMPSLIGPGAALPSLTIIIGQIGQLRTAASAAKASKGTMLQLELIGIANFMGYVPNCLFLGPCAVSMSSIVNLWPLLQNTPSRAAAGSYTWQNSDIIRSAGFLELRKLASPSLGAGLVLPSRNCGLLQQVDFNREQTDTEDNVGGWYADSVRRKRKKKMNKHKHAKRRKLNRHRR